MEKAKKFITINVINAKSLGSAKNIAFSIANFLVKTQPLEKTNWGRIVMGIGKSGICRPKLKIKIEILLLQKTERFR